MWLLIDVAGLSQFRATRANLDIALPIEDEVSSAEGPIVACRIVPHQNVAL
jgi:hypothetical protein